MITPFKGTDKYSMSLFNDKIQEANDIITFESADKFNFFVTASFVTNPNRFLLKPNQPIDRDIFKLTFKSPESFVSGSKIIVDSDIYDLIVGGEIATEGFTKDEIVTLSFDKTQLKAFFKCGGSTYGTLSPQIQNFVAKAGNHQITLSWQNPSDSNHAGTYLVRKQGSAPQKLSDGTKIDVGKATGYTDKEPLNDKLYYYRAFPYNAKKQVQTELTGAVVSAMPKAGIPLKDLPVGTLVVDTNTKYYNQPIMWKIADQNHNGYPSNSTTLISDKILTLKCFDAKEPNNSDSDRALYGNNRYIYSNMRQWLNSQATTGSWYSAQHSADAPPDTSNVKNGVNPYANETGFLNDFSINFKNSILETNLVVAKNSVTDGGGSEIVQNKIFLLSNTEVGLTNENSISEGTKLALFTDNSSRVAKPTQECVDQSEYKDTLINVNLGWRWILRTPQVNTSFVVRNVDINGEMNEFSGYFSLSGARPLCNLSNNIAVNPVPNSDGSYNIIF